MRYFDRKQFLYDQQRHHRDRLDRFGWHRRIAAVEAWGNCRGREPRMARRETFSIRKSNQFEISAQEKILQSWVHQARREHGSVEFRIAGHKAEVLCCMDDAVQRNLIVFQHDACVLPRLRFEWSERYPLSCEVGYRPDSTTFSNE